ncbi:hypothetical protein [Leucobacter tenebrionis]|uniref:hypothetical protein n=1 Tax=Leucobacter tenebrionis TaxID=2873270 RepID=UPI001CA63414|nr:hypothetical protein [Leucobacter tenebrionis]QZY51741.1 hypothetical protein KVY00_14460 [Leucobacter tenebrionis]
MDLKFTFNGGSQASEHSHDSHAGASGGIPLPFSTVPSASSSVLELQVRLADESVIAEALSGDGVNYSSAQVERESGSGEEPIALGKAVRSALARAVAGLEGPLSEAVTALVLDLRGAEAEVLRSLGVAVDETADPRAVVDEALQRRIGVAAGTPIRFGDAHEASQA